MKFVITLLIVSVMPAVLITAGYRYLYNHGLSGKMLETDSPVEGQIKVACAGDSITCGHGISEWWKLP